MKAHARWAVIALVFFFLVACGKKKGRTTDADAGREADGPADAIGMDGAVDNPVDTVQDNILDMELVPIRELVSRAKAKAAVEVPAQMHQAYPIPARADGDLRVTFLYCVARPVFGKGLLILAPSHRVVLSAVNGEMKEVKQVTPAELGVNDPPQKILGFSKWPAGITTTEQFVEQQELLYKEYDILMPLYAEERNPPPKDAASFDKLFWQLTEALFVPYYRAVGSNFFSWLLAANRK
jgi:hypothetical protein